jgi:hypothetical protein
MMHAVASNIIFQRSLFKYVGDKSLKNNPLFTISLNRDIKFISQSTVWWGNVGKLDQSYLLMMTSMF